MYDLYQLEVQNNEQKAETSFPIKCNIVFFCSVCMGYVLILLFRKTLSMPKKG